MFRHLVLLSLFLMSLSPSIWGQETSHILLLNSYHYGLGWTDDETKGVQDVLEKSGHAIELHVEYMDSKRLTESAHFKNLLQLLTYKYRNTHFSSIIVADNDAFHFVSQYRDVPVFAGIPVIFTGVNFFQPEMLSGLDGFTGVAETFEAGQTVDLMRRLHPKARHIVVIIDDTTTGKAIRKELEPMLAPFAEQVNFEFWDKFSLSQMRARLGTLQQDSIVLLMPFARDSEGTFIQYADIASMVSSASTAPVYGTYDFYMGHGIIGGRLTNGIAQGRAAANMLLRVLDGEAPASIPVTTVAPSEFQFDSRQLHRFGLSSSQLPSGSRILYQSWYEVYRTWLWFGGVLSLTTLFFAWGWWHTHLVKRRIKRALRESEEKLLTILEHSSNAIFLVRADGRFTYENPQAESMLGYSGEELLRMRISDTLSPDELERTMETFRRNLMGKREFIETTLIQKNGHRIIVEINGVQLPGGEVLGEVRDITERKLTDMALRESLHRIHLLLDSMAEGAYGVDTDGLCTFVNQSFLRILGYERVDEVIGKHIHDVIHHSHADGSPYPAAECKIYCAFRHNQHIHVADEIFWRKDGVAIPVEYWSQPIIVDNVTQGAIATFIDISERVQAEAEIKKSLSLLKATLESTTDAILVVDLHNNWRLYNQQFLQLWNIPERIVASKDDAAALSYVVDQLEDAEGFLHKVRELYAQPKAHSFDTLRFKDGRSVERFSIPQFVDGEVVGRVWSFRDISARKAMEEQIYQLAFYDVLTQLPNRRLLNDRLSQTLASSSRSGSYGALMFLDLDNFKPLNDTYGHAVGDLLLVEVANRLKSCVRETDTVARFGGDEFVVILTGLGTDQAASTAQAKRVAEKILASLAEPYLIIVKHDGQADMRVEHRCTSSVGVVVFANHDGDQEEIMKWADEAMYQAKESGRNSILFHNPSI
jgi:diguanylate cyclase (GGDEF)-like protein/PAS domain S-box-containing protein